MTLKLIAAPDKPHSSDTGSISRSYKLGHIKKLSSPHQQTVNIEKSCLKQKYKPKYNTIALNN